VSVPGHIVRRTSKKKVRGKTAYLYYIVYVVNGGQKWETVDPPRTRKHAEKLLAERLTQISRGEFIEPKRATSEEFKDTWMEKYAEGEGSIRPSTLTSYRGFFRNHLIPAFGDKALSRISVEDVQGFKAEKMASRLSPQTVKHLLRLLRQMLDHAIDWGYIRTNPARKVRNPKIPKMEMDFLTPEEVRNLLGKTPEKWVPFLLTAISGGLRIGEILAMRWGNLDWNSGQYYVRETWVRPREGRKASFASPKTESSISPVDLMPECLEALRGHQRRQAEEKLKAGKKYQDQGLIFATATGGCLYDKNVIRRVFHPALDDAGLRRIRFHDLRHTTASILIAQNESPKYIARQMRHASVDISLDRYGHLFPETHREAAERMGQTLFGSKVTELKEPV